MSHDSTAPSWNQLGRVYDFEAFEGQARAYLIATTPRCGSHYLGHLLRSTGLLGAPLEYFSRARFSEWREHFRGLPVELTLQEIVRRRTSPNGWFGVKAHWPQYHWFASQGYIDYLPDIQRFIRIRRRDRVRQSVSNSIAEQTGSWISFRSPRRAPEYSFESINAALIGINEQERSWDAFFARSDAPVHTVIYEELLKATQPVVHEILELFAIEHNERMDDRRFEWLPAPQSTHLNLEWSERFRADYADRYGPLAADSLTIVD